MVEVVPYRPEWPEAFEHLRAPLLPAIAHLDASVEHVGSTSVPGLAAKPIIDIDVVLESEADLPRAIEALAAIGYEHRGDLGITGREAFSAPPGTSHATHVYLVVRDNQAHRDHVDLRDYLRTHPEIAQEYATLKATLAARYPNPTRDDSTAYTDAKADFVQSVLAKARAATGSTGASNSSA